jgi:hypothetical protein
MTRQVSANFFKQTKKMRASALLHLDKLRNPLLLLLAGNDELMKNEEMEEKLSRALAPAALKTVFLPKDYHLALIENPTEIAMQITTFIDQQRP